MDVSGKPAVNISRPDHSGLTIPYGLLSLGLWCGRLKYLSGQADIPAFFVLSSIRADRHSVCLRDGSCQVTDSVSKIPYFKGDNIYYFQGEYNLFVIS